MGQPLDSFPPDNLHFPDDELRRTISAMPVRILIAEDDPYILLMLEKSLRSENYDIVTASDGEAAWEAIQNTDNPPQLAILDWMMPKMDGLELCRRIKQRKDPFVFTIMLTAKSDNNDIISGLQAGADEFITKPFHLEVLRNRVAAGARIVRLENLLTMKNSILEYYIQKVENLAQEQAKLLAERETSHS